MAPQITRIESTESQYPLDNVGVDDDGRVRIPEGPGLGVEYDWDDIESHTTGVRTSTRDVPATSTVDRRHILRVLLRLQTKLEILGAGESTTGANTERDRLTD
ncbi:hypothetical protein DU502_04085 [Haloplanus aerogenes]|uniref:Enolase-like protein n=1 Tax=Haloplanus aerogenes TaxID=660522 RepID=A0A3G8QQ64_9EURY|nr:hypothetical protein [Haloplanus aerogenes]AZH24613.1 hypothetical protein DU502_04085 [Haloplanus aerogenes]